MKITRRSILAGVLAVAGCLLISPTVQSAEYPDKPIKWVIGFGAGGASDYLTRTVAKGLEKAIGTQVVVENRPGASGIIAAGLVHEAEKDGYTIVLMSSSYFNNVALGRKFDFDPLDFEPIGRVAKIPNLVVVPADSPIKSIEDLIAAAKAKPGELNYASGGVGTGTHIGTELFKSMAGVDMTHIPYKGTKPALLDLVAGRVDVMFAGASPALPLIKGGKLRALATTSEDPTSAMPELEPVAKTVPGFEAVTWYAAFAPKDTPKAVIDKLNTALSEALDSDEVKAAIQKRGFDPALTAPDKLTSVLDTHLKQTKQVAEKAKISLAK